MDCIVHKRAQINLWAFEVSANDGLIRFLPAQLWFIECGALFGCHSGGTLFILFRATWLHHGWHKQKWKTRKMKWNRILHRTAFALWFKVMDEFAFFVSFLCLLHVERWVILGLVDTPNLTAPPNVCYSVKPLGSVAKNELTKNPTFQFSSLRLCPCKSSFPPALRLKANKVYMFWMQNKFLYAPHHLPSLLKYNFF